jgi:zinc/manganese transport system permease protein
VIYVVAAAAAFLLVDKAPQGAEHIKQLLVGSILTVTAEDLAGLCALYALVAAFHWLFRRRFLLLTLDPARAKAQGLNVGWWDFLFYASFGIVVTSSVAVAGVLLVFSF